MRKIVKLSGLVLCLFFMLAPVASAQVDFCEGNFDYDKDVDGTDASTFKQDFGRSSLVDPCPPDGPAPVPKTGQTTTWVTGDNGDLETGVAWPNPRFMDNADGTVTDKLTGLIWLKDANCFEIRTFYNALSDCNGLASGSCGLTDGSGTGEWRLPHIKELQSLIDFSNWSPALSSGHPFANVQTNVYWSSTTYAYNYDFAWYASVESGFVGNGSKDYHYYYVWPVRGGQ